MGDETELADARELMHELEDGAAEIDDGNPSYARFFQTILHLDDVPLEQVEVALREEADRALELATTYVGRRVAVQSQFNTAALAFIQGATFAEALRRTRDDAAEELAAGVRAFLGSLPYMAPELLQLHVEERLAGPLQAFEEGRA